VEKYCRPGRATDDNIIRHMRFACWITKATHTHTHSEYVILIALPLQQWLHERLSMLRYTCSVSLVLIFIIILGSGGVVVKALRYKQTGRGFYSG